MNVYLSRTALGNIARAIVVTVNVPSHYNVVRIVLNEAFGSRNGEYMHSRLLASRISGNSFLIDYKKCPGTPKETQNYVEDEVARVFTENMSTLTRLFGDESVDALIATLEHHEVNTFFEWLINVFENQNSNKKIAKF
jgi:hypothetical protein